VGEEGGSENKSVGFFVHIINDLDNDGIYDEFPFEAHEFWREE